MAYGFNFSAYKVLSFEINSTLIDWETGLFQNLASLLQRLPESHPRRDAAELYQRQFLLGIYKVLESKIQRENPKLPYPLVLARIYEKLATDYLKVPFTPAEAAAFGASAGTWPAYLSTVDCMAILAKHYKLVALTNLDKASFAAILAGPLQSKVKFDAVYSAEDIGSYKPDLANFRYLIEHVEKDFGAQKHEILHISQNLMQDHVPAKAVGLPPGVWINGNWQAIGVEKEKLGEKVQLGAELMSIPMLAGEVKWYFDTQVQ